VVVSATTDVVVTVVVTAVDDLHETNEAAILSTTWRPTFAVMIMAVVATELAALVVLVVSVAVMVVVVGPVVVGLAAGIATAAPHSRIRMRISENGENVTTQTRWTDA
jgi:hypothetical protein